MTISNTIDKLKARYYPDDSKDGTLIFYKHSASLICFAKV